MITQRVSHLNCNRRRDRTEDVLYTVRNTAARIPHRPSTVVRKIVASIKVARTVCTDAISLGSGRRIGLCASPYYSYYGNSNCRHILKESGDRVIVSYSVYDTSPVIRQRSMVNALHQINRIVIFSTVNSPRVGSKVRIFTSPTTLGGANS